MSLIISSLAVGQQTLAASDTFGDPGVREIVNKARAARLVEVEGLESYEVRIRERLYVGLGGSWLRRSRGLLDFERVAQVRWASEGPTIIRWLGARQDVPILGRRGVATRGSVEIAIGDQTAQQEINSGIRQQLLTGEGSTPFMGLKPGADQITVGADWAYHPLADSSIARYRFSSGDTLRVSLPSDGRVITLIEVRVQPKASDPHLVAGSLWFDSDTGALVRAGYKPARPFNLELDDPDEADNIPGILKPITGGIEYVTIEYSLHELRYWLPRRMALEGYAQVGRFLRIPITIESSALGYVVNEAGSELVDPEGLPDGWDSAEVELVREGEDALGEVTDEEAEPGPRAIIIVPPIDSLLNSPTLSERRVDPAPQGFSSEEIEELRSDLSSLLPDPPLSPPSFLYGLRDGLMRYNRVEGLSGGVGSEFQISRLLSLRAQGRIGIADRKPRGELFLNHGDAFGYTRLGVFRRLSTASDWEDPHRFSASFLAITSGNEHAPLYRNLGGELQFHREGRRTRRDLRFFWERHAPALKHTNVHLYKLFDGDTLDTNIQADRGNLFGADVTVRWQRGLDPQGLIASGLIKAEVGAGDFDYRRALTSVALVHPLPLGVAGALEGGLGATWGSVPIQRSFYLGGPRTARGFESNALGGGAFWFARAEVGNDFTGARVTLFTDVMWVGTREDFGTTGYRQSVGAGLSLLDGLMRLDFAWITRGGSGFRTHTYTDALF